MEKLEIEDEQFIRESGTMAFIKARMDPAVLVDLCKKMDRGENEDHAELDLRAKEFFTAETGRNLITGEEMQAVADKFRYYLTVANGERLGTIKYTGSGWLDPNRGPIGQAEMVKGE